MGLDAFQGLEPPCLPGVPGNEALISSDPSMYSHRVRAACNFGTEDYQDECCFLLWMKLVPVHSHKPLQRDKELWSEKLGGDFVTVTQTYA